MPLAEYTGRQIKGNKRKCGSSNKGHKVHIGTEVVAVKGLEVSSEVEELPSLCRPWLLPPALKEGERRRARKGGGRR